MSVLKPDPISSGGKKYKGRSIASNKNHTVSNLNISLFDKNTRVNQRTITKKQDISYLSISSAGDQVEDCIMLSVNRL